MAGHRVEIFLIGRFRKIQESEQASPVLPNFFEEVSIALVSVYIKMYTNNQMKLLQLWEIGEMFPGAFINNASELLIYISGVVILLERTLNLALA